MKIEWVKERKQYLETQKKLLQQHIDYDERKLILLDDGLSEKDITQKMYQQGIPVPKPLSPFSKPFLSLPNENDGYIQYRNEHYDRTFLKELQPIMDSIPTSNGSKFFKPFHVNIGIISDEFLFNAYKDTANFFYITKNNYKHYAKHLDVFLLVTTWKGLEQEWVGLGNTNVVEKRQEVLEILDYYKALGIKTVFYSKEDPINYKVFIDLAKHCDYIFTSAAEKVECYKMDCDNDRVYVLDFGINPTLHHPIGMRLYKRNKEVLFAGSWYNKYPERQRDTEIIFDTVIQAGYSLRIIDRNFNRNHPNYYFPKKYTQYLSPAVSHETLQKMHKCFNWAINLNSVKFSETMCASRVYELQALGNLVLSNPSLAIERKFPNLFIIEEEQDLDEILRLSEEDIYKLQVQGIRKVMSKDTTFDRLNYLLEAIGFSHSLKQRAVAVVVKERDEKVLQMFNQQTYQEKALLLESELTDEIKNLYDMVTFFDKDMYYGRYYLEDMINAFKYTDCDYVVKDAYYAGNHFIKGVEHDYVCQIQNKNRTIFWSSCFLAEELLNMSSPIERANGYSIDPFEYNTLNNNDY